MLVSLKFQSYSHCFPDEDTSSASSLLSAASNSLDVLLNVFSVLEKASLSLHWVQHCETDSKRKQR